MHCEDACGISDNSCVQHCNECCGGSCVTQVNFDCDMQCFTNVEGGCTAQCEAPSGALFCNGQYIFASDVEQCISWLLTQGISVDVSARGSLTCDLSGCHAEGEASSGFCNVSAPGRTSGLAAGLAAATVLGL